MDSGVEAGLGGPPRPCGAPRPRGEYPLVGQLSRQADYLLSRMPTAPLGAKVLGGGVVDDKRGGGLLWVELFTFVDGHANAIASQ
jgi:hypothetical protein